MCIKKHYNVYYNVKYSFAVGICDAFEFELQYLFIYN